MSQLVRLEGKHSTQNAHCALGSNGLYSAVLVVQVKQVVQVEQVEQVVQVVQVVLVVNVIWVVRFVG